MLLAVGAAVLVVILLGGLVTCSTEMSQRNDCEQQATQEGYRGSDKDRAVDLCVDYEKRFGSAATGAQPPPLPPTY